MKELTELLEKLSTQLGTTVEKLWGVLVSQAPIIGAVDLILCVALVAVSVFFFRLVNKKTTPQNGNCSEWDDAEAILAWGAVVGLIVIVGLIVLCSVENIATAFLNPEYWALMNILGAISGK